MIATAIRKITPVGIDLGASAGRAVQLSRAGGRVVVTCAVQRDHEPSGEDGPKHLNIGLLARTAGRASFAGRGSAVALSSPDLAFHMLELPAVAIGETGVASPKAAPIVQQEIERLTGGKTAPLETRYWPLPKTNAPGPNSIGVAAQRPIVEQIVQHSDGSCFRCDCLTTAATALVAVTTHVKAWPDDSVWGVLDLGLRESRLVLCTEGVPVLIRRAGSGGSLWTERIAQALDLSAKSAEVHKCEHGIAAPSNREMRDEANRSELPSLLLGALRAELTDIAAEIKRSYEYVLRCYTKKSAGDLVLVGGGARMPNLPEFLSRSLGISVKPLSAFSQGEASQLEYRSGQGASLEEYAVAIGAALEACDAG